MGLEPTTICLEGRDSSHWATPAKSIRYILEMRLTHSIKTCPVVKSFLKKKPSWPRRVLWKTDFLKLILLERELQRHFVPEQDNRYWRYQLHHFHRHWLERVVYIRHWTAASEPVRAVQKPYCSHSFARFEKMHWVHSFVIVKQQMDTQMKRACKVS